MHVPMCAHTQRLYVHVHRQGMHEYMHAHTGEVYEMNILYRQ
jgi:hypothetical protein